MRSGPSVHPKQRDFGDMTRKSAQAVCLLRAMSNVARLNVLCELARGEVTAGQLVKNSGLSQSALSQHLARLRLDGVVGTRRDGQTIHYRIADPNALRIIKLLYELYCAR